MNWRVGHFINSTNVAAACACLSTLVSAPAAGVHLFTPPVRSFDGDRVACAIQNLGESPVTVNGC